MAKAKNPKILTFVAWLTGVIVSLAVGFSMIGDGALNGSIPWLSDVAGGAIVSFFGWIVVATTIIGVILAIMKQ